MRIIKKNKAIHFLFSIAVVLSMFTYFGCDDSGQTTKVDVVNPNVKTFDSIWVEEDSPASSFTSIDLLSGINVTGNSSSRDCSLRDSGSSGLNFFLRSGIFLDNSEAAGYESRFFRAYNNLTKAQFDTISYLDAGAALDSLDFTQESTEFWGYFNVPLNTRPVYCFYLQGKKAAGLNNNKRVYGIIWPIESSDNNPGVVYGFKMSFKVKININGENDFRKMIPGS